MQPWDHPSGEGGAPHLCVWITLLRKPSKGGASYWWLHGNNRKSCVWCLLDCGARPMSSGGATTTPTGENAPSRLQICTVLSANPPIFLGGVKSEVSHSAASAGPAFIYELLKHPFRHYRNTQRPQFMSTVVQTPGSPPTPAASQDTLLQSKPPLVRG